MDLLSPSSIAIASALTIPPLVALYFLKLRRKEVPISSTYFWKRAVHDLQVNAPFQKIRKNLLMFLQLLVLLLAALALGQPLLQKQQNQKSSLILMIDQSASMSVIEPDGKTRLRRAKDEALKIVQQMRSGIKEHGEEVYDRAMVIAFSDRARMMAPFTSNKNKLENAIEAIVPVEGFSKLREAVSLAEAHLQTQIVESEGAVGTPVPTGPPAKAILFSDGRIYDATEVTLERMEMELVNVGINTDNVGVVSAEAIAMLEGESKSILFQ